MFDVPPRPEHALAITYAPPANRTGLNALLSLDATLARLARRTREPMVAQLRLAWWRDSLGRLEASPIVGQPLLAALHGTVLPTGVRGAELAAIVDGWEALIAGDAAAHGRDRGRPLFAAAAQVLGTDAAWVGDAGDVWALADLATTSPDRDLAAAARALAEPLVPALAAVRASRAARPLAALALIARMDLAGLPEGSPSRVARLLKLRLTGR